MGGARGPAMPPVPAGRRSSVGADSKETVGKALEKFKQFQSGMSIGSGYKLGQMVSSGTQGDVFTCTALFEGHTRHLAIKRVRTSKEALCRQLLAEVAAVFHARSKHAEDSGDPHSFGHPNIVGYVDWFAGPRGAEQEVYIAMERCEFALSDMVFTAAQLRGQIERTHAEAKGSLERLGGRAPAPLDPACYRVTEREVVKVMHQMLSALAFLNTHGLMHRDIKSDNILWVAGAQPEGAYKLCDFGTAAFAREGEPGRRETNCGTLWTMAPEMLGGRTHGPNCDSWSLGVVLFQLAALDYPFGSKELMAYRNSIEASAPGSFWPAMCGPVAGAGRQGAGRQPRGHRGPEAAPDREGCRRAGPRPRHAAADRLGAWVAADGGRRPRRGRVAGRGFAGRRERGRAARGHVGGGAALAVAALAERLVGARGGRQPAEGGGGEEAGVPEEAVRLPLVLQRGADGGDPRGPARGGAGGPALGGRAAGRAPGAGVGGEAPQQPSGPAPDAGGAGAGGGRGLPRVRRQRGRQPLAEPVELLEGGGAADEAGHRRGVPAGHDLRVQTGPGLRVIAPLRFLLLAALP